MKRVATALAALALLLLAGSTAEVLAQDINAPTVPHLFLFESAEDTEEWINGSFRNIDGNAAQDPDDPRNRMDWFPYPADDNPQGAGAAMLDWSVFACCDWGGSIGMIHTVPIPEGTTPENYEDTVELYDLSDFTHLSLMYNVLTPTEDGTTFQIHLIDASQGAYINNDGNVAHIGENWRSQVNYILNNTQDGTVQAGWREYVQPLEIGLRDDGSQAIGSWQVPAVGFSRPGCFVDPSEGDTSPAQGGGCWSGLHGDLNFDLDRIAGFQIELGVGTDLHAGTPDSSTSGVIAFDHLRAKGVRYELLASFDTAPGGWGNGAGTVSGRSVVTTDSVEGTGAFKFDYTVNGTEGWGGSADFQVLPAGGTFPNMNSRTALTVFYKVLTPVTKSDPSDNVRLTFKLFENSTGQNEEWQFTTYDVLGDTTGRWRRLYLPFKDFAIPSWMAFKGDETLNQDAIVEIQAQVIVDNGESATGSILFDRFASYGSQQTDFEGPAAVEGFEVQPSDDGLNIISWTDVPGEEGERYDVYYSLEPITDVTAPGVLAVATGIQGRTEVAMHQVYAPITDQPVAYYYAILATDEAGNPGELVTTGSAISNTGKGLATISLAPPSGFVADGDLGEWSGITPIHISPNGTVVGHVASGTQITGDADLSADAWLAVDNEALYFALDVTDDVYVPVADGDSTERWLYDGAELYIGLYNEVRPRHGSATSSGSEPDYKFYLYLQEVFRDGLDVATNGDGNYSVVQTDKGYAIEARLPYALFAYPNSPAFVPQNGMRIPLDIVVMDNDTPGADVRSGILAYSPLNDDDSYLSPTNWLHTWIGDRMTVDVEQIGSDVPTAYVLEQNYPNPFNPSTIITYALPASGKVTLKVFNVLGQEVMTLFDGVQNAGRYEVRFDAHNLPSGVYFYQIHAGSYVKARKMLLVR